VRVRRKFAATDESCGTGEKIKCQRTTMDGIRKSSGRALSTQSEEQRILAWACKKRRA